MDSVLIPVQLTSPQALLPRVMQAGDVAADVAASEAAIVPARARTLVATGLVLDLPPGYRARLHSRSGLSLKHGIEVGAGLIDQGYRHPVGVLLYNHSDVDFAVAVGDRIAQLCIERYTHPTFEAAQAVDATERGAGWGSSGIFMTPLRVALTGAGGQMGREVVKALRDAPDMALVAAVSPRHAGRDVGELAGLPALGLAVTADLDATLAAARPDVLVDFTRPEAVMGVARAALAAGVRPVIGSTGLTPAELDELRGLAEAKGLGVLVAPNFAIGALLMIRFAAEAARYFGHAEVIELHHDRKHDAPSGTALKTLEAMTATRPAFEPPAVAGTETLPGSRGGERGGVHVHSVRLPGLLAHQEVLFGGAGQLLTIRHDALSRECYMPGVLLGIRQVMTLSGLVYGLEHVM